MLKTLNWVDCLWVCWVFLIVFFNIQEDFREGGSLYASGTMSGIGNKRTAGDPGPSAPPEKKAGVEDSGTTVETIKLGGVSSTVCLSCTPSLNLFFFFFYSGRINILLPSI